MQSPTADAANVGLFPEVQASRPLAEYNATPYTPEPYDPTKIVADQHHFPRFGHTNDVAALAEGGDAAVDYVVGILSGALLILAVAVMWALLLVGLRVCGQRRVGFLAGRLEHPDLRGDDASRGDGGQLPLIEEEPADGYPLLVSEHSRKGPEATKRAKKFQRTVRANRAAFVLSGVAVIVSSILFLTNGIKSFQGSLVSVNDGLELVQKTAARAADVTNGFLEDKNSLGDVFQQTQQDTRQDVCAGDSLVAAKIRSEVSDFSSELSKLGSTIDDTFGSVADDLQTVVNLLDGAEGQLSSADIFLYIAIAVISLLLVIILAMLVVTYFSARDISNGCTKLVTNAILWPVFVFFLLFAWIFSLLFLVTSLAGSDFCYDPDRIVNGFLEKHQDQFNSVIFGLAIYYTSGCQVEPAGLGTFMDITKGITAAVGVANQFSETIMGMSLSRLETSCGLDEAAAKALQSGAEMINKTTLLLNDAFIGLRGILECRTFNSIYTTFVHDALCGEGVNGLGWIFSTSFFIFVFSMLMITFRAGLYPVKNLPVPASQTLNW